MKVLIKTFVLGANHGQFLQALGLASELRKSSSYTVIHHSSFNNHLLKEILVHALCFSLPKFIRFHIAWIKNFKLISPNVHATKNYDATIFGSDMIWSNASDFFNISSFYFQSPESRRLISYAPSSALATKPLPSEIINKLCDFYRISVRDYNTRLIIKSVANAPIVCDPSFFLFYPIKSRDSITKNSKRVALVYGSPRLARFISNHKLFTQFTISSPFYSSRFNLTHSLKTIRCQLESPLAIINRYKEASLVITETFHGTILALAHNVPFVCFANELVFGRLEPYLKFFSPTRIVNSRTPFDYNADNLDVTELLSIIDFKSNDLNSFIDKSRAWLHESLLDSDL